MKPPSTKKNVYGIDNQLFQQLYGLFISKKGTCSPGNKARRVNRSDKSPILFKMTLDEWIKLWMESGHASKSGRGKGKYVVSRFNDYGDYEVGNVFIQSYEDNIRQAQQGRPKSEAQKLATSTKMKGRTFENLVCPHCERTIPANNKRHHFDNCKQNPARSLWSRPTARPDARLAL